MMIKVVGNSGRYSKFQQRLRNIYLNWIKKKKKNKEVQDKFVEDKVNEIKREVGKNRTVIVHKVGNIKDKQVVVVKEEKVISKKVINKQFDSRSLDERVKEISNDKNNVVEVKTDKISKKEKISKLVNDEVVRSNVVNTNEFVKTSESNDIDLMKVEIINKLKNKFVEKDIELEVLESELYFVKEAIDNSIDTRDVKELRKKLKEIIDEINSIIEQFNLYNRSYDLSNVVGIDDECIIDNLIEYRELLDNSKDRQKFVKEYKLLEEFKSLYTKLNDIKSDVSVVDKCNLEIIDKYEIRDEKYNQVKLKLLKLKGINNKCLNEINRQNEYLNKLIDEIGVIDSKEILQTKLCGIGDLFYQGLKFVGLKLLSPFSSFIPGIALETIMVRNMVKGAYDNVHSKEIKRVYYSAVDFDSELNNKLIDIKYTEELIDDTLVDLKNLKENFLLIYDSNIPGYDDTLKNINIMEEVIYKNKYKIDYVKKRLNVNKKINEDKMYKVKKLNEDRY